MSSTGCEQLGWELLGGAAERVTRSVSGTKASHCANNGNACCIARSLICRWLLLPATFTPRTSRQCNSAPLVQSLSLPFCAAITNFACILATPRPLSGLRGVASSSALLFSPSSQTSPATRGCHNNKKKKTRSVQYALWCVTDGGWCVIDGGWWVIDGGWCVTDGGCVVTDGGWWVADGGWWVTDGGWCVTDGGWCVTDGGWWVATKHQRVAALVKKKKG